MATAAARRKKRSRQRPKRPDQIHTLSERPKYIRAIIYGDPGTGKTVAIGKGMTKLGDHPSMLLINADGPDGPESIRQRGGDPDVWDVNGMEDLMEISDYLRHDQPEYDWVWLDSVTLLQESGMDRIMEGVVDRNPKRSLYIPDRPQYLLSQNWLGGWVRQMRALPYNFGMSAHEMRIEDEDGEVRYLPAIHGRQGDLSNKFCGYVSIVGRLHVVTTKRGGKERDVRVLETRRHGKYYGKDRFDATGGRVIEPSVQKITELVNNGSRPRRPRRKKAR